MFYETNYQIHRFFVRLCNKICSAEQIEKFVSRYFKKYKYPIVLSTDETLKEIIEQKKSIARFGDGEYLLCFNRSLKFQPYHPLLQKRLIEILANNEDKVLVGIIPYKGTKISRFWTNFWFEFLPPISKILINFKTYAINGISRDLDLEGIKKMSQIWDNKDVIFVFGNGSRFDVDHILFEKTKSKQSFTAPAVNAWQEYDLIYNKVKEKAQKVENTIVICSLGPTATVLAFDLGKLGIQTLDIGHLTNIYDYHLNLAPLPEELPLEKD